MSFNTLQLDTYAGSNPYILNIEKKYRSSPNYTLTPFENEYLLRNFMVMPYKFNKLTVEVGEVSRKYIYSTFDEYIADGTFPSDKKPKQIDSISFDSIIGETDEWYHVKYGIYYFWLFKSEVGDLYEKVCNSFSVDFNILEKDFTYSLHPHQRTGVQFLLYHKKAFLLDTVGAGKTHTAIGASLYDAKKVLIICIAGKQIDWSRELLKWGQESKIIYGKKNTGWLDDDVKYTIIGCDVLKDYLEIPPKNKKNVNPYTPILDESYDCIIIDEVQKFKKTTAKKSKVLTKICMQPQVKYVWSMSGTMVEKNEEFYNICRNVNISITDIVYSSSDYPYFKWNAKFEDFIKRYCGAFKIKLKTGKSIFIRKENTNTIELHQRIKHLQRRRRTEKVIEGFPDKIETPLYFELSPKQWKKYSVLYDNYMAKKGELDEEETVKFETLKNMIETQLLRQFLAVEKVKQTVLFAKSEAEDGKCSIIFTNFKEEYLLLKKLLGNIAVCIDSGSTAIKKQAKIDEFLNDSKKSILLGNIESIGTGFNIIKADNVIHNSLSWRSDLIEQGNGRTWRTGRLLQVNVYYPIFAETVEETIIYPTVIGKSNNRSTLHGEKH